MKRFLIAAAALAGAVAVSPAPAMAVGLVATTQAFAGDPLGDNNIFDQHTSQGFLGPAHSTSEAIGFGALAVAETSADYGVNRAFAHATSPDLHGNPSGAFASASSLWVDDLTVNTTAQSGFLSVEFQFHAFAMQSSYDDPSAMLEYVVQLLDLRTGNQIVEYELSMDGSGNTNAYLPTYADGFEQIGDNFGGILRIVGIKIPFTAYRPFGIASRLGCGARADYDVSKAQECDANGTSLWGGITGVTDADGNPLSDWTVTSASGTDYTKSLIPPPVAGVPEPASWAMLVFGMFAIGGALRRKVSYRVSSALFA